MSKDRSTTSSLPTQDEITRQLEQILASPDFHCSPHQVAFLKYVVEQTLAGNAHEIKGYTLATKVLGRGPDFDQNTNPIVSIQAGKLRQALELYYLTAGKDDIIRIDIPKGSYIPTFEKRVFNQTHIAGADGKDSQNTSSNSWPSVCVHPFQNLTGDPDLDHWGIGLAIELATELTRYPDVRVLVSGSSNQNLLSNRAVYRFEIQGSYHLYSECIKVAIILIDGDTSSNIWTDTHRFPVDAAQLTSYQENVAKLVAAKVAGEYGVIARSIAPKVTKKTPRKLTTFEAFLRFYQYNATLTRDNFIRALESLENAVVNEPESGQAWCMLGRLYGNIYSLDYPGFEDPLEKAHEYAHKGVMLAPDDQRCRGTRAYIHLFQNDLEAGLSDAEKALNLRPNSLFVLDGIGYLMTLMGEWERGTNLIHEVIRSNPFYSNIVHYALWLNWLRQENYSKAYVETQHFNRPALFWDHLATAASLGLLDRIEEGQQALSRLLNLKPDFSQCGRRLIHHYIKFDELVERVVRGLNQLGLEVQ